MATNGVQQKPTRVAAVEEGQVELHRFEIRLDVPLAKKEAKVRGLDGALSRLVLQADRGLVSDFVFRCKPGKATVFVHAVGPFVSLDKVVSSSSVSGVQRYGDLDCVGVASVQSLESVLSVWDSEILVIFFSTETTARDIVTSLTKLEPKWWQLSEEGYEAPYLKQLQRSDPFFFFAPTRSALEVIGSKKAVTQCFLTLTEIVGKALA